MDRGIGDNGGPPLEAKPETKLSAKIKLIRIQHLLERSDLSSTQKCIGIGIIAAANMDGEAKISTRTLQLFATAKDRETIFRATKKLEDVGVVKKTSRQGQGGTYRVMSSEAIEAIAEAYLEMKSGRDKPDGTSVTKSGDNPVEIRSEPAPELVGTVPTGSDSAPSPSRARADNKITNNINNITTSEQEDRKGECEGETSIAELELTDERVSSSDMDALRVFETYNELAQRVGLPTARSLTPDRKKTIKRRLKEHGGYDAWELVLTNIARSAFLQGRNPRGWRPTGLNWFLEREHFTKVIEGGYGNGAHADDPAGETLQDRYARMMADMDETAERQP
jgi:hypothetical protein